MSENSIIETYRLKRSYYVAFTDRLQVLIEELLKLEGIKIHLIESRAKSVESFAEKIRRPGKSYTNPLEELPDLSGVRIIVYYQDDVEKVAKVLSKELVVVESVFSHQQSKYSADQFGYLSLHYVVKLTEDRASLPEWSSYKDLVSEIQIRTVLQHSWAAVSQALQYKIESDVPKKLRRKLFRLAGLFELADEEFISVRDATEAARVNAEEALAHGDNTLTIDSVTLSEFIRSSEKVANAVKLMKGIGYLFENALDEDESEGRDILGSIAKQCERIDIKNIGELKKALNFNPEPYLKTIIDKKIKWFVSDEFTLYLLLIRGSINSFAVDDLLDDGWGKPTASKVIKHALSDYKKANK